MDLIVSVLVAEESFITLKKKKSTFMVIPKGYGRAEHTISVSILKRKYTDYEITSSNEGY